MKEVGENEAKKQIGYEPLPILGREKVLELIETKKKRLSTVFQNFEPVFDAAGLYQTPDAGWQVNFTHTLEWNMAAMTLRPGDHEVFEVHGGICEEWYSRGGAWDNGKKGQLGWPLSDELSCDGEAKISLFERGTIFWEPARPTERVVRTWEESVDWFNVEAAKGLAWAQARLGDCFMNGCGLPRDYGKAFKWFNAAKGNGLSEIEPSLQDAARHFILSL